MSWGNLIERLIILNTDEMVFAADLPVKYQSTELAVAERPENVEPLRDQLDQLPEQEPEDLLSFICPTTHHTGGASHASAYRRAH